jgi:hypothetical protein
MPKHPLYRAFFLSVIVFGTAIFAVDIWNLLSILIFLIPLLLLVIVSLFILEMLEMALKQRKIIYWQAILIVVLSVSIALTYRIPLTTDFRFFLLRPYYESQLAKVRSGESIAGVQTEHQLVAFAWNRGILDRWVGLVYDPTESLSLPRSIQIFGGLVYKIHHLDKGWYLCYFN